MIASLSLALFLAVPSSSPSPQGETPPEPAADVVESTVSALEKAFEKGAVEDRVRALELAAQVPHASVVAWVEKGLSDEDLGVVESAIETLRFLDHPAALEALHSTLRRDKRFVNDEQLTPKVLRAIGQYGSEKSIDLLTKDLFKGDPVKARTLTQARILALGNIRSKKSVESLLNLMQRASHKNVYPFMDDLRLALMRLTGVDRGKAREDWQAWWNEHKKELEVAAEPPPLPQKDQRRWDKFWGNERQYERRTKRGERGKD